MNKYKCIRADHGYEHLLVEGQIYSGLEIPGDFADSPYLIVYGDEGQKIATAHLSRFELLQ